MQKSLIKVIKRFVTFYTLVRIQRILSEHIVPTAPTELHYIERPLLWKDVNKQID